MEVVAGAGDAIRTPLTGAGQPNPLCASYEALKPDPGENAHSLGMIITFGKLRIADLGDLYWNQEHELVCPVNKLGTIDLYMTTHHGTATSGPPQIVHIPLPAHQPVWRVRSDRQQQVANFVRNDDRHEIADIPVGLDWCPHEMSDSTNMSDGTANARLLRGLMISK